jgi:hypothetical protein
MPRQAVRTRYNNRRYNRQPALRYPWPAAAITVSAAQGATNNNGIYLRVLVLNGVDQARPIGATGSQSAVAAHGVTISPTVIGSWLIGATFNGSTVPLTANTGDTLLDDFTDSINTAAYGAVTQVTTSTSSESFGTPDAFQGGIAVAELIPAAGSSISLDPSTPGFVVQQSVIGAQVGPFSPPAGAVLVALIATYGSNNTSVITAAPADSGNHSWMQVVSANAAGQGYQGIWIAYVTPPVPISPYRARPVGPLVVLRSRGVSAAPRQSLIAPGRASRPSWGAIPRARTAAIIPAATAVIIKPVPLVSSTRQLKQPPLIKARVAAKVPSASIVRPSRGVMRPVVRVGPINSRGKLSQQIVPAGKPVMRPGATVLRASRPSFTFGRPLLTAKIPPWIQGSSRNMRAWLTPFRKASMPQAMRAIPALVTRQPRLFQFPRLRVGVSSRIPALSAGVLRLRPGTVRRVASSPLTPAVQAHPVAVVPPIGTQQRARWSLLRQVSLPRTTAPKVVAPPIAIVPPVGIAARRVQFGLYKNVVRSVPSTAKAITGRSMRLFGVRTPSSSTRAAIGRRPVVPEPPIRSARPVLMRSGRSMLLKPIAAPMLPAHPIRLMGVRSAVPIIRVIVQRPALPIMLVRKPQASVSRKSPPSSKIPTVVPPPVQPAVPLQGGRRNLASWGASFWRRIRKFFQPLVPPPAPIFTELPELNVVPQVLSRLDARIGVPMQIDVDCLIIERIDSASLTIDRLDTNSRIIARVDVSVEVLDRTDTGWELQ